jgi:hypothetical protein
VLIDGVDHLVCEVLVVERAPLVSDGNPHCSNHACLKIGDAPRKRGNGRRVTQRDQSVHPRHIVRRVRDLPERGQILLRVRQHVIDDLKGSVRSLLPHGEVRVGHVGDEFEDRDRCDGDACASLQLAGV